MMKNKFGRIISISSVVGLQEIQVNQIIALQSQVLLVLQNP